MPVFALVASSTISPSMWLVPGEKRTELFFKAKDPWTVCKVASRLNETELAAGSGMKVISRGAICCAETVTPQSTAATAKRDNFWSIWADSLIRAGMECHEQVIKILLSFGAVAFKATFRSCGYRCKSP